MILFSKFVTEAKTPLAAYNLLQIAYIRLYIAGGGTVEQWCLTMAEPFRERFGWIMNLEPGLMNSAEVLDKIKHLGETKEQLVS